MSPLCMMFLACLRLRLWIIVLIACHYFLVPATAVPEIVQLIFNMKQLEISSMSEVRRAFLRHTSNEYELQPLPTPHRHTLLHFFTLP